MLPFFSHPLSFFSLIFTFMYSLSINSWSVNLLKALLPMCISSVGRGQGGKNSFSVFGNRSLATWLNWWASLYYFLFFFFRFCLCPKVSVTCKTFKHYIPTNWLILFIKSHNAHQETHVDWWDNDEMNSRAFCMMSFWLLFPFSLHSICWYRAEFHFVNESVVVCIHFMFYCLPRSFQTFFFHHVGFSSKLKIQITTKNKRNINY